MSGMKTVYVRITFSRLPIWQVPAHVEDYTAEASECGDSESGYFPAEQATLADAVERLSSRVSICALVQIPESAGSRTRAISKAVTNYVASNPHPGPLFEAHFDVIGVDEYNSFVSESLLFRATFASPAYQA